ncbi:MAG: fructose-bisphosphate aldolase class II [Clostridium sp.]|jgi:fructose-bisphosphate aldolase class II
MLANFKEIVEKAAASNYIIPGFNVFGYEDAIAVVKAAEELHCPVILMTNKLAVNHMPVEYWGNLLNAIAKDAKVPVGVHLDHTSDYKIIMRAIMSGYSSVMYDGSQLPLKENIKNTKELVKYAHACNVYVEAEIGSVPYPDIQGGAKSVYTEPNEANEIATETGVDWLAVAVGTVHRMQKKEANIQYDRIIEIQKLVTAPLVLHGASGIKDEDISKLINYHIGKINVGTVLRMAFVKTLSQEMRENPNEFDKLHLFKKPMEMVQKTAKETMKLLGMGKFNI